MLIMFKYDNWISNSTAVVECLFTAHHLKNVEVYLLNIYAFKWQFIISQIFPFQQSFVFNRYITYCLISLVLKVYIDCCVNFIMLWCEFAFNINNICMMLTLSWSPADS